MSIAPAHNSFLGVPGPLLQGLLLVLALGVFAYVMVRRLAVLRLAAPDPRFDNVGARLRALLVIGFGQARQPRYPLAGTLHILIFFGFMVLSVRSLTMIGEAFVPGFALPLMGGVAGRAYSSFKDYTELLVLLTVVVAAIRRGVFRPARYHDRHATGSHAHEAYVVLGLIGTLMIADGFFDGSEIALVGDIGAAASGVTVAPVSAWQLPLASLAALPLRSLSAANLLAIHLWSFWIHNVALLGFLCYLPISKHFHVITSLPNVLLSNQRPSGEIKPPRFGVDDFDDLEEVGVGRLEDFSWKHVLDFYSCTDCGRCSDSCPAYATGTPLSPRMISIKARDQAYAAFPVFGKVVAAEDRPALVGEVIADAELWACTTCGACEEACPIMIEYVDKVVDMRRFLVDSGRVPKSLQEPLANLEKRGNPYGKMQRQRGDWIDDEAGTSSGVRRLDGGDSADSLFFTDSAGAYDPRIQQVSRSFGAILHSAGVDVGTLGGDEVDSGHEARRMGEEGLFESLREQNLEAMGEVSFTRVVTCDPHAMNSLRHDYALEQPVRHHTEVLAELIEAGSLRLEAIGDDRTFTFHDPCYLGRHNGVYDPPRQVLAAIPGLRTVEMERSRNRSFCCGGGSLNLFYEGESETRMGEQRVAMAEGAGADVIVTACPFCLINLEDAVKTTGREGSMEVIDIAELVARAAPRPLTDPARMDDGPGA